jgi:hypothetical protein
MKYTIIVMLLALLMQGCALYWSDDALLITCFKDYDLKKLTSTSNKVKGEYRPFIEVETMP